MSSLMRILIFVCASGGIVALSVVRKRKSHHLWLKRIKFKKISLQSDIGRCFGADIGRFKIFDFIQLRNFDRWFIDKVGLF